MTQPEAVETLESAGDRWKGGVEWSDDWERWTRHWWRRHPTEPILIHRASGEQVAYLGQLDESNWHRFEYQHGETTYPLAVEMKRVTWPNPDPNRYVGPPYDGSPMPELSLRVWRIDHLRSADLWRKESRPTRDENTPDEWPPYWLWRRVDHAIVDAALLWPRKYPSDIAAATEVAVNGGWLNGAWRNDFYRRMRRNDGFGEFSPRSTGLSEIPGWPVPPSIDCLGLPLTDYDLGDIDMLSPQWTCVVEPGVDLQGRQTSPSAIMRNSRDGSFIAATPCDVSHPRATTALVVVRDGISWALPVTVHGKPFGGDLTGSEDAALGKYYGWGIDLRQPCSIFMHNAERVTVPWLMKPVSAFDGIGKGIRPPHSAAVINHPLSSFQTWRFLYECFLNSLPCSPGFAAKDHGSGVVQGDQGEVKVLGGFVGGTQGLVTEIRLKLDLPSDAPNASWSRHFS